MIVINPFILIAIALLLFTTFSLIIEAYALIAFMFMMVGFISIVAASKKYRYLFNYIEHKL